MLEVSAPGKHILMGEHAAVYHRPALVAAAGCRLRARLDAVRSAGGAGVAEVALDLPQVGVRETVSWPDLVAYADARRAAWEAYRRRPQPARFAAVRGDDPAHLVKVALGEAARFAAVNGAAVEGAPSFALRLDSAIPIGAGFGSSAAVAVAVLVAYLRLRGLEPPLAALDRAALEIERRQHGSPSGVDTATVLRGGVVWVRAGEDGTLRSTPVALRSAVLGHLRAFSSGAPAETTGAVVAAVRARHDAAPERVGALFERMARDTRALRAALEDPASPAEQPLAPIRDFQRCLEALGVVPPAVHATVRAIEARGGAAKISGAGALSGHGAGSVLVYHPGTERVEGWPELAGLEPMDLLLGAEGVRTTVG